MLKYSTYWLGKLAFTLGIFLPATLSSFPANTVELRDGRRFFNKAPDLVRFEASITSPATPSTYQVAIALPADAGEPLKAVAIAQKPNLEQVPFDLSKSSASLKNSLTGGRSLPLPEASFRESSDQSTVTVVFGKPVEPGNTVTISLRVKQNPLYGGIYLFGVTAFPEGENSSGLYLGVGRIHLTPRGNR